MAKIPNRKLVAELRREIEKAASQRGPARLRTDHQIGRLVLQAVPERSGYGRATIRNFAEKTGVKPERLYHCREFAARYSLGDLKRLIRTAPMATFSHVVALMSIENAGKRKEFEKRLAKEALSVVDLRLEIQEQFSKRRQGGRNVSLGTSPKSAFQNLIVDVVRLTKRWNWRKKQIEGYLAASGAVGPRDTIDQFRKAAKEIGALVPESKTKPTTIKRKATRAST